MTITLTINHRKLVYDGNPGLPLLKFLRHDQHLTAAKDGCSGEGTCGACLVAINRKPKLACRTQLKDLDQAEIITLEGVPENEKIIITHAFANAGAVQCGFCTPGMVMHTWCLLQTNPDPSEADIRKAISLNLCRCTGYVKIIEAVRLAAVSIAKRELLPLRQTDGKIGTRLPKYNAVALARGEHRYVADMILPGMLSAALKFSDHPRARIRGIDTREAEKLTGVHRVFTAADVPGERLNGLIYPDWPLMIAIGETTRYIGDVLAGVVADTEEIARTAAALITIDYEVLPPVVDPFDALKPQAPQVHPNHGNLLDNCVIRIGNLDTALSASQYIASGQFQTQRIEHAFLETECALATPLPQGIQVYSQSQGVYEDSRQIARLLDLEEEKVRIILVENGGAFGGKEDMTVQGHAALFAWLLKQPVKVSLARHESLRMHPKRHPITMDMTLACDAAGKLTAMKLTATGDSGAYASVGTKVMERVAGHATGGYFVPVIDLESRTVYTNNIPSGAMRGFGANQVLFALESLIDELCAKGQFDRWQFRYNNALVDGSATATGQVLHKGVGIRACLEAVKPHYDTHPYTGLACAIKNCGIGNGMPDFSDVKITIVSEKEITLAHGWTEMGQGVHTIAIQALCQETGLSPELIAVKVDTAAQIKTGMTTSSRGTTLLGNAIIEAAKKLRYDLQKHELKALIGKTYQGRWLCNWTTKPGSSTNEQITHYAYGYACQLAIVNEQGKVSRIIAAHDAGKIFNPLLFEGQIEGAVHMGLGFALTENLPMRDGRLVSEKLRDCQILRAKDMPKIDVIGVEVPDPVGPYGAKGVGEIGLIPTAAAIANALTQFDGVRRYSLPLTPVKGPEQ